jgi:peptidoglycan/xylan/chitin deacetylase (PgdA/CDA1 family)
MRLDRLLTLYFFQAVNRLRRPNNDVRIPILMYHSISDHDAEVSHPYFQTNTRPEVFVRQMQFLADNNYKVISLSEAVSLISEIPNPDPRVLSRGPKPETRIPSFVPKPESRSPKPRDRHYVVITFDDGYRDFHDVAWPILKKHSYTATMFLPTGFINSERKQLNGRDCLTWDEVKAMAGEGVNFGAHSVSHVQLYDIDRGKIAQELISSKVTIEEKLGKPVDHYAYALAYPEHDKKFVNFYEKTLREAGYQGAVSTRIGTINRADDIYCLKRIPANSHDDIELLQAKLEGDYDWLNRVQVMKKNIRFTG